MRDGKTRQLSEEETEEADFARLQRRDAEIEAEFQRVVAATKTAGRKKGSAWLDSRSPSWPTSAG